MRLSKDYYRKKFKNTFFGHKLEEHKLKKRLWLFKHKSVYLPLLAIVIIGSMYFLFYSPTFKLTGLEVKGLRDITFEELQKIVNDQQATRRLLLFKQNNFFWFSKGRLAETLNHKYALEILIIKKKLFHKLSIYLQEHTSALTWISGDKFYYLDLEGKIITEVPFKDPNPNFPRIYDESSQLVNYDQSILSPNQIKFIIDILTKLPLRTGEIEINSFKIPDRRSNEIKVVTKKGWQIYFNTNLDTERQLDKLVLIYEKKVKELGIDNLEYIDLRFGNKVFYK